MKQKDVEKAMKSHAHDLDELDQCREVLGNEIATEDELTVELRTVIAAINKNLHEVVREKERISGEVSQSRKIYNNFVR